MKLRAPGTAGRALSPQWMQRGVRNWSQAGRMPYPERFHTEKPDLAGGLKMKNVYVRVTLIIVALSLGVVLLATFAGLGAVRVAPDSHGHAG